MDNKNHRTPSHKPLHQIFRSQIVQKYPPDNSVFDPFIAEEPQSNDIHNDIFDSFMR